MKKICEKKEKLGPNKGERKICEKEDEFGAPIRAWRRKYVSKKRIMRAD